MRVITARNVQSALLFGVELFRRVGETRDSRNGPVIIVPGPVTTHYTRPRERVLFWPQRDANPFFHFFESLWMLAGRNDVAFVSQFAKQMAEYSDDGQTTHGAYGHRWRNHFMPPDAGRETDQLLVIARRLKKDPTDRRCVLTMYDPYIDLDADSRDIPCNTHVYFSRSINENLDMTVCCRSNDMIWGGYGANAVHFSVLQEFMAAAIGCGVGNYWHISNNYHAYKKIYDPLVQKFTRTRNVQDPYMGHYVQPQTLVTIDNAEKWLEDCANFCKGPDSYKFKDPFFNYVAKPLWKAHAAYKAKNYDDAIKLANECQASDWKVAAREWLERRKEAHERAKDDGPTYTEAK